MVSVAFKTIPQPAATTFALSFVFILLEWYSRPYLHMVDTLGLSWAHLAPEGRVQEQEVYGSSDTQDRLTDWPGVNTCTCTHMHTMHTHARTHLNSQTAAQLYWYTQKKEFLFDMYRFLHYCISGLEPAILQL